MAMPVFQELNKDWRFKKASSANWFAASVPGTVHTDLIRNHLIEDPYFRLNERDVQWVDKEDWVYETKFMPTKDMLSMDNIRLHFKGLDTYADVYLNGDKILSADNMFREWHVNIKGKLINGQNTLTIYFHSPIKTDLPKLEAQKIVYDASNDQSENGGLLEKKVSVFARKAGYHYGWDWGPRIVTSGIWRPVVLEAWNEAKIEDVFFQQKSVTASRAEITTSISVLSDKIISNALVVIRNEDDGIAIARFHTDLKQGYNKIDIPLTIIKPKLWWSNGLGVAHLYHFRTQIVEGKKQLDYHDNSIGIRSLKLVNESKGNAKRLYFELNGVPVFAKGANFIPSDMFLPRVTKEIYKKEIDDAADANMNMLRVWGGGVYQDDYFYQLCDEKGILVWQDFMFACSLYPADSAFLANVKQEAIDNITRLRNHPSIALWCGNNEINEAWYGWGWKKNHLAHGGKEETEKIWGEYNSLFNKLLPAMVAQYAPQSYYRSSSPYSRDDGVAELDKGDAHYWSVWHGKEPISKYNEVRSLFFSEYGFQSFPAFESIKLYAPDTADWNITSDVMMSHQRGGSHANELIRDYLIKNYKEPKTFQDFLYVGQVLQGDAIKTAMEAHRRDKPYCMGTLFWQHNDCWPVASWSSRDYYKQWKAQHYFARQAYKDILVSPIAKDGQLDVYIVSDRLTAVKGTLWLTIWKMDGAKMKTLTKNITLPANSSQIVFSQSLKALLDGTSDHDVVIATKFVDEKGVVYSNNYFLAPQKDLHLLKPLLTTDIVPVHGGFELSIHAKDFVRALFLSIDGVDHFFENNYFDILPNETIHVKVRTSISMDKFKAQLRMQSLNEI